MFYPPNNAGKVFNTSYCCSKVISKWITFHTTGTPILHVEASFISVERGLHELGEDDNLLLFGLWRETTCL